MFFVNNMTGALNQMTWSPTFNLYYQDFMAIYFKMVPRKTMAAILK